MKKTNGKFLLMAASLLLSLAVLASCSGKDDPAETQGILDTSAPTDTAVQPEDTLPEDTLPEETLPEDTLPEDTLPEDTSATVETDTETEPATEPETETSAPEAMPDEEVLAVFEKAVNATSAATEYKTSMDMKMSMMGMDLGSQKMTQAVSGENLMIIQESDGVSVTVIFLGDTVYMSTVSDGEAYNGTFTVDDAQRAWLMSQFSSDDSSDADMEFTADSFTGITGTKAQDGSVTVTATGLSEEVMAAFMESMAEMPMDMGMELKTCTLRINPQGLIAGISLDLVMSASVSEEGVEMDVTASIQLELTAEYENVTVAAPENASEYESTDFEIYFAMIPTEEEAVVGGMPLDQDSYVIGGEGNTVSPDEQFMMLAFYPRAYAGKSFTIYGTVGEDTELGVPVINAGEYGTFYFYCPDGVAEPVFGDSVKITATFENTVDKGYDSDYYCYTMMVSDCEVLAHGVGPNGGRIMFITASVLNVRTSSDTSSSSNIIGTLSMGDAVEVFEQDANGWWRIEFNGQTAYISNKYVSETRP